MKTKEKILVYTAVITVLFGSYFIVSLPEEATTSESIRAGVQCLACWFISLLCLFVNVRMK